MRWLKQPEIERVEVAEGHGVLLKFLAFKVEGSNFGIPFLLLFVFICVRNRHVVKLLDVEVFLVENTRHLRH